MSGLEFAEPHWLHLLWGIFGGVALLVWLDRRGTGALHRFVSAALGARLVQRPSVGRRRARIALLATAGVAMTLALMRPQWGGTLVSTPRSGAEIMIALDVSRSMLAEDVVPNRLERAKAEIRDLLNLLEGDQVGLIAFAGRAAVLSPLTPDFGFVALALADANPGIVGRGGTRLEEPIRKAVGGFGSAGNVSRSILLITDGEDHDSFPVEAARAAAERGVRILAIGFGDEAGAPIMVTDPRTGAREALRDSDGREVQSRLDGDLLRELAQVTDGAYIPAGTGLLDLPAIHRAHIAPLTRGKLDGRQRIVKNDVYQWPLLLALLALLGAVASTAQVAAARPADPAGTHAPVRGDGATQGQASTRGERRTRGGQIALLMAAGLAVYIGAGSGTPLAAQAVSEQSLTATSTPQGAPANTAASPAASGTASAGQRTRADTAVNADPAGKAGPAAAGAAAPADPAAAEATTEPAAAPQLPPRTAYNEGLLALGSPEATADPAAEPDLDAAERLLESARSRAGSDAELRYRATFNLGWVAIKRAEQALDGSPEKALEHLQAAGRWFGEAVRLQPQTQAARQNLELTMRRAMQLADSLAERDTRDVTQSLDALIDAQRVYMAELAQTVARPAADKVWTGERERRILRALATKAIDVLEATQGLEARAAREARALSGKDQPDAASRLRQAQLEALGPYLRSAATRITQTRSRLRRAEPSGAYRRAARALGEMQRARDQLRAPLERLDALLQDGRGLMSLTALAGANPAHGAAPALAGPAPATDPTAASPAGSAVPEPGESRPARAAAMQRPDWLTNRFLEDEQETLLNRTRELEAGLAAALEEGAGSTESSAAAAPDAAQRDALREQLGLARPHVAQAAVAFAAAREALAGAQAYAALTAQSNGQTALDRAREAFLDRRRLIDKIVALERLVGDWLGPEQVPQTSAPMAAGPPSGAAATQPTAPPATAQAAAPAPEVLNGAARLHAENAERLERLGTMLARDLAALGPPPQATGQPPATGQDQTALLTRAQTLRDAAQAHMDGVTEALDALLASSQPATAETLAPPRRALGTALESLEALQRLFFSVLEHLRETAERQTVLNDDTETLKVLGEALGAETLARRAGPLGARQTALAGVSGAIGEALARQAQAAAESAGGAPGAVAPGAAAPGTGTPGAVPTPGAGPSAEQLQSAAGLVVEATEAMAGAGRTLDLAPPGVTPARSEQDRALEKLRLALAELSPPPPESQPDQEQQDQERNEDGAAGNQPQPDQQPRERGDLAQLLQGIRDREAERRESRNQRAAGGLEAVEKDW